MRKENWIWMPHAGHFICGNNCQFHLFTYVGKYVVSTVGELVPDEPMREIEANAQGITLEGKGDARLADWFKKCGYEELGYKRLYETMVFKAKKTKNKCCPWGQVNGSDLDFEGYNDAGAATKGHYKMCLKWSKETVALAKDVAEKEKELAFLRKKLGR